MHCNQYFKWLLPQALLSFFYLKERLNFGLIFFPYKMKHKRASREEYKHLLTCFSSSAPFWYFVTFRNWNFAGFLGASFANREGQALKQQGSLWLLNIPNKKEKRKIPWLVLHITVFSQYSSALALLCGLKKWLFWSREESNCCKWMWYTAGAITRRGILFPFTLYARVDWVLCHWN